MLTTLANGGAPSGQTWPSKTIRFRNSRIAKVILIDFDSLFIVTNLLLSRILSLKSTLISFRQFTRFELVSKILLIEILIN